MLAPRLRNPVIFDLFEAFTRGLDIWLCGAACFLISVGLSILRWSQPTPGYFDRQIQFAAFGVLLFLFLVVCHTKY